MNELMESRGLMKLMLAAIIAIAALSFLAGPIGKIVQASSDVNTPLSSKK